MMTTTTSGHPGIGDPAREPPSRRDRGAHRFPCRAKTRMSRAEGASRPRSLAPPARLPDWPTDGRRRTTRTRTRAGFSPLDASDVPKKVCLQHDSITRDCTSSLHRVARAAPRAHLAPHGAPAPPPALAPARAPRGGPRARRARPVARVRAVPRRFERARPPRASCDRRVRRVRGERGGPPRRARVRGGQAPREARRGGPPRGRRRRQARGRARGRRRVRSPRALATVRTQDHRRRRRVVVVVVFTRPRRRPLLLLLLLLDDDAVRPRPRRARGPGRLRRSPRTLRTLRTLRPERRGVDDGGDAPRAVPRGRRASHPRGPRASVQRHERRRGRRFVFVFFQRRRGVRRR